VKPQWKELPRWFFVEGRRGWVATLTPLLAWLVAHELSEIIGPEGVAERAFRTTGMLLQLAGLVVVAHGLISTQRQFASPSIQDRIRAWAGKGARLLSGAKKDGTAGQISIPWPVTIFDDSIHLQQIDPTSPLDQKIAILSDNLRMVTTALETHQRSTHQDINRISMSLSTAEHERLLADARLREELINYSTGGIALEWVGFFWLLLGTVFGSFSPELGALL